MEKTTFVKFNDDKFNFIEIVLQLYQKTIDPNMMS